MQLSLTNHMRRIAAMPEFKLTTKEIETAALLADGLRRIEVAGRQGVSINTVKARIDTLLFKTYARNTAQMVHVLTKRGLLMLLVVFLFSNDVDQDKHRRYSRRRLKPVPTLIRGPA